MFGFEQENDTDQTFEQLAELVDTAHAWGVDVSAAVGLDSDCEMEVLIAAREQIQEELQREFEKHVIAELGKMKRCPCNFAWRKVGGGYRCEGGSHYVTDQQAKELMNK